MCALENRGVKNTDDWQRLSLSELEKIPSLSRKLIRMIDESIQTATKALMWDGHIFRDDRLFILDLQTATKSGSQVWAVVTRWNRDGFPPYKVDDFDTQMEAIQFIKSIEPRTPRISLGGAPPREPLSYVEYLETLRRRGEPSSFHIYQANKHQKRTLILEEVRPYGNGLV